MLHMKDLKVSTRLRSLVAAVILGLIVTAVVSYFTVEKVRVGGALHHEITFYSDLNGDITSPALDIEQVRYAVLLILADDNHNNRDRLPRDNALFQERKKAYIDANEQWKKEMPEGKIKD